MHQVLKIWKGSSIYRKKAFWQLQKAGSALRALERLKLDFFWINSDKNQLNQ